MAATGGEDQYVYSFNFGCSCTTCSHAWADKQKSFGHVEEIYPLHDKSIQI